MRAKPLLVFATLALLGASCGDTAVEPTEVTTALSTLPAAESDLPAPDVTAPNATTTTTAVATTTVAADPTTSTTLVEGEPSEFGPRAGDVLTVIGVRYDDTLNLRAGPSPRAAVVGTIEPTYEGLVAAGKTWQLPAALWTNVVYDGLVGWVNLRFVAYAGATDDVTAAVVAALGGYPVAPSLEELGRIVAEALAGSEPGSVIVISVAPTLADRSEVTYDVVGIGDDAVAGVRAHVFAVETETGFVLDAVEARELCARGTTPEGLCI
jgi:hypothetical protein